MYYKSFSLFIFLDEHMYFIAKITIYLKYTRSSFYIDHWDGVTSRNIIYKSYRQYSHHYYSPVIVFRKDWIWHTFGYNLIHLCEILKEIFKLYFRKKLKQRQVHDVSMIKINNPRYILEMNVHYSFSLRIEEMFSRDKHDHCHNEVWWKIAKEIGMQPG